MTAGNKVWEQNLKYLKPYEVLSGIIPFALYCIS